MRILLTALGLCFAAGGCSGERSHTPPPIQQAPGHLASLRIHVNNATQHAASEAEEDVAGYTIHLRGAVQRSLVRAGYRVVVSAEEPRDLVARISADWPWERPGTATMSFVDGGGAVIDQISGLVRIDENSDIDERSAVALVEAMKHSPELAAFARLGRERRAGSKPRPAPGNGTEAAGAGPDAAVPPAPAPPSVKALQALAPAFCERVLAGDREFIREHVRLPLPVQLIASENRGNPILRMHSVSTVEGVVELAPCRHVDGLDPELRGAGSPPPKVRRTGADRFELSSTIGQFDATLEFQAAADRYLLVGYRAHAGRPER
ncbi:MAG: hypothetical protein JRI55_18430 [Deltaproteobacteria bacterium]|jgi:hypothetical protein|nr:hypothetical protein [Deltaproteobacteria bacterium]